MIGARAVLVPVKAFGEAKLRLAPVLSEPDRRRLAQAMAEHVLEAAAPLPVAVVCDDADVATWAADRGAIVVMAPGRGLNRAVETGVVHLRDLGVDHVTVAHADLPLAGSLAWVGDFAGATLVPDYRDDGTNVIGIPTASGFRFAYGPGSFRRHVDEAERVALDVRVVREPTLTHDVDVPADLAAAGLA